MKVVEKQSSRNSLTRIENNLKRDKNLHKRGTINLTEDLMIMRRINQEIKRDSKNRSQEQDKPSIVLIPLFHLFLNQLVQDQSAKNRHLEPDLNQ